jgi:RNA recognition motif-containing protein
VVITIKKLFVGSLPWGVDNQKLQDLFAPFGEVTEAVVLMDKMTGRSRGFGFVTMADDAAADEAVNKMNGADVDGRKIVVNEARPREDRPQGDNRGGGGRY